MTPLEMYIRQAAASRGINPDIAVRVASAEGGLNNPFRHGEGPAPSSQAPGLGSTENSYGPFQLYISGTGAGLGDKALAAGIDPRKDWQAGVNFALDQAKAQGWSPWYGARAAGITGMTGIGNTPAVNLPPEAQNFVNNNPQPGGYGPGISDPNAPSTFGSMAPQPAQSYQGIPTDVAGYASSSDNEKSPLAKFFDKLKEFPDGPQAKSQLPMPSATNGDALLKYMSNPNALTDFFLKQRLQGIG